MTPAESKAIEQAMRDAAATADAEAEAKFGKIAADVCAACADLANQMKFFVQIIDGDMTPYALQHAAFLARVIDGVSNLAGVEHRAFQEMMFKLAESRFYIHQPDRRPNA